MNSAPNKLKSAFILIEHSQELTKSDQAPLKLTSCIGDDELVWTLLWMEIGTYVNRTFPEIDKILSSAIKTDHYVALLLKINKCTAVYKNDRSEETQLISAWKLSQVRK